MPINNISIGHDMSVDVFDTVAGKVVSLPSITGFSAEPQTKQIQSQPLDDAPLYAELPDGWKGTIDFDRTDNRVDLFFADRESRYYKGQNLFNLTIMQTIKEQDNSVSQYRFKGVALKLAQAGQWKAQDKVSLRVDWVASKRERVV